MTKEMLDAGTVFSRYLDVDGDGIPFRTYPGTHPTLGGYFARGTSRNANAQYSEAGEDYVYNVQRLLKKFETAKTLVPQPVIREAARPAHAGVIYYGSTSPAMAETIEILEAKGLYLDRLRLRAFPFSDSVREFIDKHDRVFVVEQNRDGQIRTLLINELDINPSKLVSVLHYDGAPITARAITDGIASQMTACLQRKAG
jgi:2-oxoglutarate ferredoxin oxidoreductase subunit alpha